MPAMTRQGAPHSMAQSRHQRNTLGEATSPYLLQHADNPVHWQQWGPEVLQHAAEQDRPILLSIGYAACHWCHVMAHESFESESIADLMNRRFVNVKVDREERPDIDQIYMAALHAMGEQGGWPLTMFLDPAGRPFWGGTYFPPEQRYGRPGFPQILEAIIKAWSDDRQTLENNASALERHLQGLSEPPQITQPSQADETAGGAQQLQTYADATHRLFDGVNGGIGGAPKFPNAPFLEIWLRASKGDPASLHGQAFLKSVTALCNGGIYDHVGGGLARYAVDAIWLVPHFEKMLYDNAFFIRHLAYAWRMTGSSLFRNRIEKTVEWLQRKMLTEGGGFASSLDADSEGEEGKYYVWEQTDIEQILGDDAPIFIRHYGISREGNFEGANIPNRLNAPDTNADEQQTLLRCLERLHEKRIERIPPARDDKVLADWNGYMIAALAFAGFTLDRRDFIELSENAYRFVTESMTKEKRLGHSWRDGKLVLPGLLTDYAAMSNAAISLYEATANTAYLTNAEEWIATARSDYHDGSGGFFLTAADAEGLLTRPRADSDDATPSGASQMLDAMARLSGIAGDPDLLDQAWRLAANLRAASAAKNHGTAGYIASLHSLTHQRNIKLGAVPTAGAFAEIIRKHTDPATSVSYVNNKPSKYFGHSIPVAEDGTQYAILCQAQSCSAPMTAAQISDALQANRGNA